MKMLLLLLLLLTLTSCATLRPSYTAAHALLVAEDHKAAHWYATRAAFALGAQITVHDAARRHITTQLRHGEAMAITLTPQEHGTLLVLQADDRTREAFWQAYRTNVKETR
jgi:chromosome condensin MukBEF MukE localization factor